MITGGPLDVIQPGNYKKQTQLLPGSVERKLKLVDSLEELKKQVEEDNKSKNTKTRVVNALIITMSVIIATKLLLGGSKDSNSKKNSKSRSDIFRYIGLTLSIAALIKGVGGMGNSYVEEVERKSGVSDKNYSNYSDINTNKSIKNNLIALTVETVIDIIIKFNMMSLSEIKSKIRSLKFKNSTDMTKKVINEIVNYEYK